MTKPATNQPDATAPQPEAVPLHSGFTAGLPESFAVQILPNTRFPEMLEGEDERLFHAYLLPEDALAETSMAELCEG